MIVIGSTNPVKVNAVVEVIKERAAYAHYQWISTMVVSEVSDQPLSIEETIAGAKNRAKNGFAMISECDLSFGIESGLFLAPGTRTGYLEACICSLFDGKSYFIGMSCGFEVPPSILELVLQEKMDLGQACAKAKIVQRKNLGREDGLIGLLTGGHIDRKQYTKQAVITALAQREHAHWY